MEGDSLSERAYNHVAFRVKNQDMGQYRAAIENLGLEMRESRPRIEGEGHSIYFYDYDNHLFELHAGTLDERLALYRRA
jgi:catechol 2,3-dioxygenase-like lactoylglutathione lyase family enzyme